MRRRKVLVVIVRAQGPRVLLLRRRDPARGLWHPVTGHVEEGERGEEAARREVREETGLEGENFRDLGFSHVFTVAAGPFPGTYEEQSFACEADRDDVTLSDEHVAHEWVSPDEALRRLLWEHQRDAVRRAVERVG